MPRGINDMPIYEYMCESCNENFSLLQWISSPEEDTACPKCGSKNIKKMISPFSCSCSTDSESSGGGSYSGLSGGG